MITESGAPLDKENNTQLALAIGAMIATSTLRATALEAQGLSDLVKLLTPKRLDDAFKGANQLLTGTSNLQRLPGGTKIQMGTIVTSATADVRVTFPEMYASAPRGLIVNHANYSAGSTSSNFLATPANITTSGFDVSARIANTDARAVVTVSWLAFS